MLNKIMNLKHLPIKNVFNIKMYVYILSLLSPTAYQQIDASENLLVVLIVIVE